MINHNLQPKSLKIDTSEIWISIANNWKYLDLQLIWNYKYGLDTSLIHNEDVIPEAPYNCKNWRYFAAKHSTFSNDSDWGKPTLISHITKRTYVSNARIDLANKLGVKVEDLKKPDYSSLDADFKLEFILGSDLRTFDYIEPYPNDQKSLSEEFKMDVVQFFDDLVNYENSTKVKLKSIVRRREYSDPSVWLDSGYDVYHLRQSQFLYWNEEDDFFLESLTWFLIFLDPKFFNKEYLKSFCASNDKSLEWLLRTIKILKLKYPLIIKNIDFEEKLLLLETFDDSKLQEKQPMEKKEQNDSDKQKVGRPKKTHIISVPILRKDHPNITDFTMEETAAFFKVLRKYNVIINDKSIQSSADLAKLIACQTGYSEKSLQRELGKSTINKELLVKLRDTLSKFIELINRDIK